MSAGDLAAIVGTRVQRVDGPLADVFVLTLHGPDRHGCLLLRAAPRAAAWGWLTERPRGAPATSFVQLLRKHLENGRVIRVAVDGAGGELAIRRAEVEALLRLEVSPANLVLVLDGVVAGAARPGELPERGAGLGKPWNVASVAGAALPDDASTLAARGEEIAAQAAQRGHDERLRAIEIAVERRRAKLRRRLGAIEGDLARQAEVDPLRERASLLLAHLHAIPKGAVEAEVTDWNADPPRAIRVAIDPALGAQGQAEALFRRARKMERGAQIALARRAETQSELERLGELLAAARASSDEEELRELERRCGRLGASLQAPAPGAAHAARPRLPYRTFRGSADRRILVGRSAADNDALTARVARPWDRWLHARGVAGSHVLVPLAKGEACPPELLIDAAHLAAHFSDARQEPVVDVQHTDRRYVRKPRSAPAGAVTLANEKVLALRVEPERLRRLLGAEDHE